MREQENTFTNNEKKQKDTFTDNENDIFICPNGLFINGEFVNIIQYSILENEWRIRK